MTFDSSDKFEKILTKFDSSGVNVWLQVEPGDNDLIKVAEIVFKKYGHHSCVQGFGVDLEWWYRKGDDGDGKPMDDATARRLVEYVRGKNPEYTVFLKHWETNFMPPNERDHLVFVDDSQGLGSLSNAKHEFGEWARTFENTPVMFQIGYDDDERLWSGKPIEFAEEIKNEVTKYNDQVGIIWVDFTMKKALSQM